jgi:hypothetical protein
MLNNGERMKMNIRILSFAAGVFCLSNMTTVMAGRQDQFAQKFNNLLQNPYVQYNSGKLDILYKLSWPEMITLGLVGGVSSFCCYKTQDTVFQVLTGVLAVGTLSAMAFKLYRIHNKIPCMSFNEQGLRTDAGWLFNWTDLQEIKIEDVYDQVFSSHAVNPSDLYQYQTGNVEQRYVGRRLVCNGKHKARLWAVEERNHWLPITLNELVDLLEFYRQKHG